MEYVKWHLGSCINLSIYLNDGKCIPSQKSERKERKEWKREEDRGWLKEEGRQFKDSTKLDSIVKEFWSLKISPRDRAIDIKLSSGFDHEHQPITC